MHLCFPLPPKTIREHISHDIQHIPRLRLCRPLPRALDHRLINIESCQHPEIRRATGIVNVP